MLETLRFEAQNIDVNDIGSCAVLNQMFNKQNEPFDWSRKEELLNHYHDLIITVFQPYGEYNIFVYGSNIAIDRKVDGERVGVIGIIHIP